MIPEIETQENKKQIWAKIQKAKTELMAEKIHTQEEYNKLKREKQTLETQIQVLQREHTELRAQLREQREENENEKQRLTQALDSNQLQLEEALRSRVLIETAKNACMKRYTKAAKEYNTYLVEFDAKLAEKDRLSEELKQAFISELKERMKHETQRELAANHELELEKQKLVPLTSIRTMITSQFKDVHAQFTRIRDEEKCPEEVEESYCKAYTKLENDPGGLFGYYEQLEKDLKGDIQYDLQDDDDDTPITLALTTQNILHMSQLYNIFRIAIPAVRMYAKLFQPRTEDGATPATPCLEVVENKKIKVLPNGDTYGPYAKAPVNSSTGHNNQTLYDQMQPVLEQPGEQIPVVMAYGYSGSGKTYTMIEGDGEDSSLIHKYLRKDKNPVTITFYECYGWAPTVLQVENATLEPELYVSDFSKPDDFEMKPCTLESLSEDNNSRSSPIEGSENKVEQFKTMYRNLKKIREEAHRTAETPNNTHSSRSHLFIVVADAADDESSNPNSKAVFVDMAGSEDSVLMGKNMWEGLKDISDDDTKRRAVLPYLQLDARGMLTEDSSTLQANYKKQEGEGINTVRSGVQRLREGVFINETLNQLKAFFLQRTYNIDTFDTDSPEMRAMVASYDPRLRKKEQLPILAPYVNKELNEQVSWDKTVRGLDQVTQLEFRGEKDADPGQVIDLYRNGKKGEAWW